MHTHISSFESQNTVSLHSEIQYSGSQPMILLPTIKQVPNASKPYTQDKTLALQTKIIVCECE